MTTMNRPLKPALNPGVVYTDNQLSIRSIGDGSVRLSGEIDLTNSDAMAKALVAAHDREGALTVDVGELQFIDLYGLRTLALLSGDPLDRPVRLRNVQPSLMRLLALLACSAFAIG